MSVKQEIERRFLLADTSILDGKHGEVLVQGYLAHGERTVRVRLGADRAWITIKGEGRLTRTEWEHELPLPAARELLELVLPHVIEKTRYRSQHAGRVWELDVYHGRLAGLAIAEVELGSEDEEFDFPPWLGREITHEAGWSNAELSLQRPPAC